LRLKNRRAPRGFWAAETQVSAYRDLWHPNSTSTARGRMYSPAKLPPRRAVHWFMHWSLHWFYTPPSFLACQSDFVRWFASVCVGFVPFLSKYLIICMYI
jgi:hypothetical protein